MLLFCIFATSGTVSVKAEETSDAADSTASAETAQTYELFTTDALVKAHNGKKFTMINSESMNWKIKRKMDDNDYPEKNGSGDWPVWTNGNFFNDYYDTAYDYNAGGITSVSGTTIYQQQSHSEYFFKEGNREGDNMWGGEWILTDPIDTTKYESLSVDMAYGWSGGTPTSAYVGEEEHTAYLYAYGENENISVAQCKKFTFGNDYWTTCVLDFKEEFAQKAIKITHIAIGYIPFGTPDISGGRYCCFGGFTVHAKENEKPAEKSLPASGDGVRFYNGNSIVGAFGNNFRVMYHTNSGYVVNQGLQEGQWVQWTPQRMNTGGFVTLMLKDPVKASDYKYMDIELYVFPQELPEGAFTAGETADRFYIDVLRRDANNVQSNVRFNVKKCSWQTCRVPLKDFADENGYVSALVLYYASNDSGRSEEDMPKGSVLFGVKDVLLTSYEETNCVVQYIDHSVQDQDVRFLLKTTCAFAYTDMPSDDLKNNVLVNGMSVADLQQDMKADIGFTDDNYIEVTVAKDCLKNDDTDTLEIKKGSVIVGNAEVKILNDEKFIYYKSIERCELEPAELSKEKQVAVQKVEMGTLNEANYFSSPANSIFVTFDCPVAYTAIGSSLLAPMSEMATKNGSTDGYVYGLAADGVIKSVMDYLYVNGKSMRAWIAQDYAEGKENQITVEFIYGQNEGKWFRIMSAQNSALQLGAGKAMSVEFKAGFVTPLGQYIATDAYYEISADEAKDVQSQFTMKDKNAASITDADGNFEGEFTLPSEEKETEEKKGCSGSLESVKSCAVAAMAVCLAAFVMCGKKMRRKENEKKIH